MSILRPKSTTNSSSKKLVLRDSFVDVPRRKLFSTQFLIYLLPFGCFYFFVYGCALKLKFKWVPLNFLFQFRRWKNRSKKENLVSRFYSPKFAVNRLNFAFLRQKIENPATGFVAANQCDQMGRLLFSKFCHIKRWKIAKKHKGFAMLVSKFCQILKKPSMICQIL